MFKRAQYSMLVVLTSIIIKINTNFLDCDGIAWDEFDRKYTEYAALCRQVRHHNFIATFSVNPSGKMRLEMILKVLY